MTRPDIWGVFRERAHSPGRESDDAEILRLTAKALEARGFAVSLKEAADVVEADDLSRPPALFMMCERLPVLDAVARWTAAGTRAVNPPEAVRATYRERMLDLWTRAGIPVPESRAVSTEGRDADGDAPPDPRPGEPRADVAMPLWVKRGDVHNTTEGDVVRAGDREGVARALAGLARRGIPRAILQEHVEGDLIKFYGIGRRRGAGGAGPWFRHFYHRDQVVRGHAFDPDALSRLAWRAAEALRLEVFGGDVIATERRGLLLIDLNAWPSFALYREEASREIAGHLEGRFLEGPSGP